MLPLFTLTPALSRRTGEGESFPVSRQIEARLFCEAFGELAMVNCCPLSHRMGEGQGEGQAQRLRIRCVSLH